MLHKVLFVDDDPIALLLAKLVLSKNNFATISHTASNGLEAIEFLNDPVNLQNNQMDLDKPFLIILDLNMPVMDGWEFLEEFSKKHLENYSNVKIILLSSSIDPEDINRSKNYPNVLDFLSKPFTKDMAEEIKTRLS